MDRRDFLKTVGGTGIAATAIGLPTLGAQPEPPADPTGLIPEGKGITPETFAEWKKRGQRRIYRGPNLYAIGMPIGGICAGQLYLLGDGSLGGWHIDGRLNSTGYGSANYATTQPERQLIQHFELYGGGKSEKPSARALGRSRESARPDSAEFIGEYPVATVRYLPEPNRMRLIDQLEVTARIYSPFCPLNAKESALPCTLFRFAIRNPTDQQVSGNLSGALENGVERADPGEIQPIRKSRVMTEPGLTAVLMDAIPTEPRKNPRPDRLIADFEGDTYQGWKSEGDAFGPGPARGTEKDQNPVSGFQGRGLINSFRGGQGVLAGDRHTGKLTSDPFTIDRDYLTFLIGGGNHKNQTCMNLLVGGKTVRTATGRANEKLEPFAWDLRDLADQQATLQIVDAAAGPWGHINIDQIVLADALPDALRRPRPDSLGNGTMCLALLGKGEAGSYPFSSGTDPDAKPPESLDSRPIAHISAPLTLQPGESTELVFVIAWHFPNLHTGRGQMYANWFKDAMDVARYIRDNDQRLHQQTALFRKTYYDDTTLPWWLALRLMMPAANLATGTAQWWKDGRFWGWEGVGCCHGTCTHVWNYAHAEARLFPELARSTRTMQDLGAAFEESTGRVAFRGEVKGGFEYAADGQAGTVLKCYREHLCSPDDSFLKSNWPRIKKALEYLVAKDAELDPRSGKPDGVIQGIQDNTYDIAFVGANTFVGALYLAALHAGAAMADRLHDADAARFRALAQSGREWTESKLFNGEYFIQQIPQGKEREPWQYGDGCLSDHLFGQNWARCLGLPTLYDEAKVRAALRSIYRYNWAPPGGSIRQYASLHPPEREFVEGREGGLLVCTWPKGKRPGEPVRYRDEVWTGCEYQAAAGMMWEGLVDESLAIVRAIDDRYDGALHNPWNEVECGDHYARAMAAWGVYQAVCGFRYDGPAGSIGLDPRLAPEDFAAFFTGAEGWGLITQKRSGRGQTNTLDLRWGKLRLSEFTARLPNGPAGATLRLAGRELPARTERRGDLWAAIPRGPIALEAGQTLEITWS